MHKEIDDLFTDLYIEIFSTERIDRKLPILNSIQILIFLNFLSFSFRSLHSHLKVLFIFRSHYLFTIGLSLIFSIRWNLPSTLNSNIKEFDSYYDREIECNTIERSCLTRLSLFLVLLSNRLKQRTRLRLTIALDKCKLQFKW